MRQLSKCCCLKTWLHSLGKKIRLGSFGTIKENTLDDNGNVVKFVDARGLTLALVTVMQKHQSYMRLITRLCCVALLKA